MGEQHPQSPAAQAALPDELPPARNTGNVIFIHPDGVSSASWAVARALGPGPDGDLNWDRLSHIALYRGHMLNSLTSTSNGGGPSLSGGSGRIIGAL